MSSSAVPYGCPPIAVAASAAAAPPVARLYRHALQCICAFAALADLAALMSVSKEWKATVESMSPCSLHHAAFGEHFGALQRHRFN
jgi:hypothetical protein